MFPVAFCGMTSAPSASPLLTLSIACWVLVTCTGLTVVKSWFR